jgi:hypothetical protein
MSVNGFQTRLLTKQATWSVQSNRTAPLENIMGQPGRPPLKHWQQPDPVVGADNCPLVLCPTRSYNSAKEQSMPTERAVLM